MLRVQENLGDDVIDGSGAEVRDDVESLVVDFFKCDEHLEFGFLFCRKFRQVQIPLLGPFLVAIEVFFELEALRQLRVSDVVKTQHDVFLEFVLQRKKEENRQSDHDGLARASDVREHRSKGLILPGDQIGLEFRLQSKPELASQENRPQLAVVEKRDGLRLVVDRLVPEHFFRGGLILFKEFVDQLDELI